MASTITSTATSAPPRAPRNLLLRHGVDAASVYVDYEGTWNSFGSGRYSHATLSLLDANRKTLLEASFQRHCLLNCSTLGHGNWERPHPRFDYGPLPWSLFYGGCLTMRPALEDPRHIERLARLMARLHTLRNSPEFADTGLRTPCELTTHVHLLEWLGIPVRVALWLDRRHVSGEEARAQPEHFKHLAGARFLDGHA